MTDPIGRSRLFNLSRTESEVNRLVGRRNGLAKAWMACEDRRREAREPRADHEFETLTKEM